MPSLYPLFLDLSGRRCVVVGGGAVGARKVAALLEAGAEVRVVSPALGEELATLAEAGRIEAVREPYTPEHLDGASLVFACTNSGDVNAQVVQDAKARNILVNAADAAAQGDFITPAVVRRGELSLAVTASGFPMLAARVARELETHFGPEYSAFVELLHGTRRTVKEATPEPAARRAALSAVIERAEELLDLLRTGRSDEARARAEAVVRAALNDAARR